MDNYYIGGLEIDPNHETMVIGGTSYVVSDKYKTMIRDSLIDWGTFQEINPEAKFEDIFEESTRLLNIKVTDEIKSEENFLRLLKHIHELPASAHIACTMKQFVIYEPLSYAMREVFDKIKHHYEQLVKQFIITRNNHVEQKTDFDQLLNNWQRQHDEKELDSSSIILLFINPPEQYTSGIEYTVTNHESVTNSLAAAVKQFTYPGFCPRVPGKRLDLLLKFPLNEFITAIKTLDSSASFPNYNLLESKIETIISNAPNKPNVQDTVERKVVPNDIKSYTTSILELRKQFLSEAKKYEQYYVDSAKVFNEINEVLTVL